MSRVKTVPEAKASGVSRHRTAKGWAKAFAERLKGRNRKTRPYVPKAGAAKPSN